uniref:Peroxidasin-like protein (inferred by orthology to a human protein) n=1 Tax=Strongyloides venezuelensis TaxID=75913 RepID=A0A0K0FL11_STRVS
MLFNKKNVLFLVFLLNLIHYLYCEINSNPRNHKKSSRNINDNAPRFTYTSTNQSYREGASVTINCEVIGNPTPTVSWVYNGRQIFDSTKYRMKKKNTQLTIYPFLDNDVGKYTCFAMNRFGSISHTISLKIIESTPPVIIEGPHSQTVRPSERVVFRCKARGEPQPHITWFFEGSEIQNLAGHFQASHDETELIISHVTRQDNGVFTCMAGNDVGAMTAEATLIVEAPTLDRIDYSLDDNKLAEIVKQATENVDKAIAETQRDLKYSMTNPHTLIKLFKFAAPRALEITKAREVYEESLRLIEKHVEDGLRLPINELPTNVSYESILAVSHIQTLMELSGCMNGQFREPCDKNMCFHTKYRSYDGQCNNFDNPMWGVSQMPFLRLLPPIYENGFNTPVGWEKEKLYFGFKKPNARLVSMEIISTEQITPHFRYTSLLMQWGQFLDHDITFKAPALSRKIYSTGGICNRTCENITPCFNIILPPGDPKLRNVKGKFPCMEFDRSAAVCGSGETSPIFQRVTYREQVNIITSYIDGSCVYGSTEVDAINLRDLYNDHGLLRFDIVSGAEKPYLPFERDSDMECRRNVSEDNPIRCFLAGDFRANEQLGLTSLHTIFLREHNRIAGKFVQINPNWDGETIYQETRKIIGAVIQHITYEHWLPKVLGNDGMKHYLGEYKGYDSTVNPGITNAFATAAFRFGHTLINPKLMRYDKNFNPISQGHISLHEAIFAPERLLSEGGIDPIIRGLFATPMKLPKSDQILNKELTELLFHKESEVPLDLAAMNIQRGRDHALPGYIEYRRLCNLTVPNTFEEMTKYVSNINVLPKLKKLYGHPGNIDLWVGGVIEKKLPDALVGPTFSCIIGEQFKRLRDGDRFFYLNEGVFSQLQLNQIKKYTISKIICNNGDDIDRIQKDSFVYVGDKKSAFQRCDEHLDLNLHMWSSCCDGTCNNVDSPSNSARKKRSQHFYEKH